MNSINVLYMPLCSPAGHVREVLGPLSPLNLPFCIFYRYRVCEKYLLELGPSQGHEVPSRDLLPCAKV